MASTQQARNEQARRRLARARAVQVQKNPLPETATVTGAFYVGTYTGSPGTNLATVVVNGSTLSYIPCVGTLAGMSLSANQPVLLVKVGTQMFLLGGLSGNPSVAPKTTVAHA